MAEYDLRAYGRMLTDEGRVPAYIEAIRAAVRPGSVVLELGTGTGVMALFACHLGAKRVYALEPSEIIRLAEQAAKENGMADRIVFQRALSTQVSLPEKCDVLITDLRGATPCYSTHLIDLMDTRERLLTPDARWICQADTLVVGVIDVPRRPEQISAQWDGTPWGVDLQSTLRLASNQTTRYRCAPADLLGPPQKWARISYPHLKSPHVRGEATLSITRDGPAHGLQIWFEAELFGGPRFSNAPDQPAGVYSPMFLPWEKIVDLKSGDTVHVQIDAVFSGHDYWWNWNSTVVRKDSARPVATFKQSTFKGQIPDRTVVAQSSSDHRPHLTHSGKEVRFVLDRIDGLTTQAELALALRTAFPDRFRDEPSALARISDIRREFAE